MVIENLFKLYGTNSKEIAENAAKQASTFFRVPDTLYFSLYRFCIKIPFAIDM